MLAFVAVLLAFAPPINRDPAPGTYRFMAVPEVRVDVRSARSARVQWPSGA